MPIAATDPAGRRFASAANRQRVLVRPIRRCLPIPWGAATSINRAYPSRFFAGSLNVLLWLGYVVVLSLYAHAFGAYAAPLVGVPTSGFVAHLLMTGSVVIFAALNFLGGRAVGSAEQCSCT